MINELTNMAFYKATDKAMSGDIYKDLGSKVENMSKDLLANKTYEKQSKELYDVEHKQLDVLKDTKSTQSDYLKETKELNDNFKGYEKTIENSSNHTIHSIGYNFDQLQDFMENDGLTVAEIGDDAVNNLVSRMRGTVFSVEMVNSYNDIVEPLLIGSKILHDEHMSLIRRLQWENTAYAIQMLETLQNIRQADQEVGSSLFLQMRQFMRQPVWYTLGQAAISLLKFTGSTMLSVLFGRDKTITVQEKILKATREQTEFLRTGQIVQQQGFFTRLMNQGIAGMPLRKLGRTLLSEIGIDKDLAQQREDQKSLGQTAQGGIMGKLSDLMYRGEITKKGRQKGIAGKEDVMETVITEFNNTTPLKVSDRETLEFLEEMRVPLQMLAKSSGNIYDNGVIVGRVMEKVEMLGSNQLNIARRTLELDNNAFEVMKENQTHVEQTYDVMEDVKKNTRLAVKEQKALRRQLFMQNLLNLLSNVAGNVLQFANMTVNALKGLGTVIGPVIGAMMLRYIPKLGKVLGGAVTKTVAVASTAWAKGKDLMSRAKGKLMAGASYAKDAVTSNTGKAVTKSAIKKIPIVGALASIGFGMSRLMDGDIVGAGMEVASGVSSIVPGFGTAGSVAIDSALAKRDYDAGNPPQSRVINEEIPDQMQGNFSNFEQPSINLPSDAEVLERIHSTLGDLTKIMQKQTESGNANQFSLGHDDLTYQNVYGAN